MKKVLLLSALALSLGACTVVVRPDATTAPVATTTSNLTVRFGVQVNDVITDFRPTRGTGSAYRPGEPISFSITTTRSGYVTLAIYNPEGELQDPGLRDIFVSAGTTIIPRNVSLSAARPFGRSYVRAFFSDVGNNRVVFTGRGNGLGFFDVQTRLYFSSYPTATVRDVAQTYLDVQP